MILSKRIIIVGPGGSGKDFLRKEFEKKGFKYAVSYTTRPPRDGEIDGKDYYFISDGEWNTMTLNDNWYETAEFNGWKYGRTKTQFSDLDSLIMIMTPTGIAQLKAEERLTSFIIYLDPPQDVIDTRLSKRSMPGDSMQRRRDADIELFKNFNNYDIVIRNPDF